MEQTSTSSSSSDVVSSQRSLPSTHDSGWNDPPEWALSSSPHNSSGTSTRRLLNKRVAFPLSSQTSSPGKVATPPSSLNMPPLLQSSTIPTITSAPHKPLLAPTDKDSVAKILESDDTFDKDHALTEILASLESVMTEQKIEENKMKEIRRRLDTMKSNWFENKLNNTVQRSILDISKGNDKILVIIC